MGLQVFLFSQLEDWFDAFALRIRSPLAFELSQRDVVLVPKLSFAPVLETSLARRYGVSAGLEFDLPGRFLWALTTASFAEVQRQAPFQAERLRWTLFQILEDVESLPAGLAERIAGLGSAVLPRFELASRLAQAFEGYVVNRPDWLQAWEASDRLLDRSSHRLGAHVTRGLLQPARFEAYEPWQAWLWREILKRQATLAHEHPFARFEREIATVVQTASSLGIARITLMGMPGLTMHQMRLFARLGQHLDVRWLMTNPCTSYWDDLPELARRTPEAFLPESPWLNEQGPALLGLWGKAQRDYLGMLRELETSPDLTLNLAELAMPGLDRQPTVLKNLQHAITHRSVFPSSPAAAQAPLQSDSDIQVHACQTLTHQLFVLRECLVRRMADDPQLALSACLVLCADLESARPAIHQVFGAQRGAGRMAYRIASSPKERSALAELVLDILSAQPSQLSLEQLSRWLSQTLFRSLTRLDSEEVHTFLSALADVGFVSNLSVKQGFQASYERLLLGAAMDMPITRDALGQEVLGRRAFAKLSPQALSRYELVLALLDSLEKLSAGQDVFLQWVARLDLWLLQWVEPLQHAMEFPGLSDDLIELRGLLSRAAQSAPVAEKAMLIDAGVFRKCLDEALVGGRSQGQLAGALNFVQLGAGLVAPTDVIAVLGMNHNAWPRLNSKDELDLTQAWIRRGDLSGYYQDRADLFEVFMAARRAFLVFYQGVDPSSGSLLSPSSQIAELLTTLGSAPQQHTMAIPGSDQREFRLGAQASETLVRQYTERQAEAASVALVSSGSQVLAKPHMIRLRDMVDALLDPAKVLLRSWSAGLTQSRVLSEHEPLDEGVLGDAEGGSQAWLAMEIVVRSITGELSAPLTMASLADHPLFADGPVAFNMAESTLAQVSSLVRKIQKSSLARPQAFEKRLLLLRIAGYEIQDQLLLGRASDDCPQHLVLGRGSLTLNLLVRAYLSHCLINAVLEPCSTHIVCFARSGETVLSPFENSAEACQALRDWLDFFEVSLREPKFFQVQAWLTEALLPKKSNKRKPEDISQGNEAKTDTVDMRETQDLTSDDDEASDDLAYTLTPSAELVWKEAQADAQAMRQRSAKLVESIRLSMERRHG